MFKIIAVTNRHLCQVPLLEQLQALTAAGVDAVILREKDLAPAEYCLLAEAALAICRGHEVDCILHTFVSSAQALGAAKLHLPLPALQARPEITRQFMQVGVSVHSAAEARTAQVLGASYLVAGHIFTTDSKAGLAARGLELLREIRQNVTLPLYAIGGITPTCLKLLQDNGAVGACCMSAMMSPSGPDLVKRFKALT